MAEQSIVEAAKAALREKEFDQNGCRIDDKDWYLNTEDRSSGYDRVRIGTAYAFVDLTVPLEDLPALLRYKETAKEFTQARSGAASITDSLAAAHLETTRLAEEQDRLAKEVEDLKLQMTGMVELTKVDALVKAVLTDKTRYVSASILPANVGFQAYYSTMRDLGMWRGGGKSE